MLLMDYLDMLIPNLLHIKFSNFGLHFFQSTLLNLTKLIPIIQNRIVLILYDIIVLNCYHWMLLLYQDILKHFLYIYLFHSFKICLQIRLKLKLYKNVVPFYQEISMMPSEIMIRLCQINFIMTLRFLHK